MLGGARLAFRMGHLRVAHPVFLYEPGDLDPGTRNPDPGTQSQELYARPFRILERQLQLARQRVHRRSRPLPRPFALEPQVADAAAPRRDHAADRPEVAPVGVLLIEAP